MPKFSIDYKISHSAQDAYTKVKQVLSKSDELKKFDAKITCDFDDKNRVCAIKGSQFKAELTVKPAGEGSQVVANVDIPLLLMPFKSKIQETLQKMLQKHLG